MYIYRYRYRYLHIVSPRQLPEPRPRLLYSLLQITAFTFTIVNALDIHSQFAFSIGIYRQLAEPRPVRPSATPNEDMASSALLQQQNPNPHARVRLRVCLREVWCLCLCLRATRRGAFAIARRGQGWRVGDAQSLVGTRCMLGVSLGDLCMV